MGLTSGSTHWLMSRASSQTAAAGLRLGRKSYSRGGHVSAPDPYSCRGLPGPGALPGPGPYSEGPGAYPRDTACPLGSSGPVSTGVRCPFAEVRTYRCTLGSFVFPWHAVLPTLTMRWCRVLLPVRPGGVVRVRHLHTAEGGTPVSRYQQARSVKNSLRLWNAEGPKNTFPELVAGKRFKYSE
jgi:hypothetical protein